MEHLLLLHGAIGAKDQLKLLADQLKDKYIVHAINFSGHGGERMIGDFGIEEFAIEARQYLNDNNIQSVSIFGYSMGGYVALYLAKQHPGLVRKIVTLATKFDWNEEIAAKETKMLDAETIQQKVPAFAEQLKNRHAPNDWKDVLGKTKEMLSALGKKNSLQLEDYRTIDIPCRLLLGDKDKMVTVEETIAVQQALPNATFQSLPNTPHPIEQVDITLLSSIIVGFI